MFRPSLQSQGAPSIVSSDYKGIRPQGIPLETESKSIYQRSPAVSMSNNFSNLRIKDKHARVYESSFGQTKTKSSNCETVRMYTKQFKGCHGYSAYLPKFIGSFWSEYLALR